MKDDIAADWDRLSPLLDEALALEPAARTAWLQALPAEVAGLRALLGRLLAREAEAAAFLEPGERASDARRAGDRVGPYRLLSELGRGGMGVVWLAEKVDAAVRLPVALKLPFIEGTATTVRERFERERAILAALNHPGIARLHEAGVTLEGQPYLALEYVAGEPLLAHARNVALGVRERVALFIKVLEAVRYAHASLVIHRDLKPSNLVLTRTAEVKLLDFGIAKLIDRGTLRTEQTELTRVHGRPMTIDYASPEQVRGEPLTTAADIYSLGVVLYELLTDSRPYRLKRGSQAELEEAILTADTAPPSQASAAVPAVRRALRGDLDAIVMKALEKDPAARYASVDAFIQDCRRWLEGRPVLAQPQRLRYRARRFLGRNRVAIAAGSAVALALLVGTAAALWQAHVAQQEAAKQRAVQSFLTQLFDRNTRDQPDAAEARSMSVRELLLEASARLQGGFAQAPSVKLELLNTVARLLRDIDEYERAAALGREAAQLAREKGLTGTDAYVEALMGLAVSARLVGDGKVAVAARDESLRVLDARGDHDSLLRARASANTMAQFAPDLARETRLVEEGLRLFETRYPSQSEYFGALYYLGNLNRIQGKAGQAEALFRRAIEVFERSGSRDYTSLGASHAFVGASEVWLGRIDEGLRSYETGLALLSRHAGDAALNTRFQRALYAEALHGAGRREASHAQFARVTADRPSGQADVADFDAAVYESFAFIEEGQPALAVGLLEPYLDSYAQFGRRYAVNGWRWGMHLAIAQAMLGRHAEAQATLARLNETLPAPGGQELDAQPDYAIAASWIALAAGDAEAAHARLMKAAPALDAAPAGFSETHLRGRIVGAEIALARGAAEDSLARAREALASLSAYTRPGAYPYLESRARVAEGRALLALGRDLEARSSLSAAVAQMTPLHATSSPWLTAARAALADSARRLRMTT